MQRYLSGFLVATAVVIGLLRKDDIERLERGAQRAPALAPQSAARPTERAGPGQGAEPARDTSIAGVLKRTYRAFNADRILSVGAGATFYILLAIFPGIAALVALYGLFADASVISKSLSTLSAVVPGGAMTVVSDQLKRLNSTDSPTLSFAFLLSLLISLWSANAGVKALFDALNVAYEERERRGFLLLNGTALLFTALAIVFLGVTVALVVALPVAFDYLGLGAYRTAGMTAIRYGALVLATLFAIACLYRFGPDRRRPKWQWVTWGSAFATLFWVIASAGFTWYAAHFGAYNKTYGSLGAVVGFMTWLWLSVTIVLLGATLNCEIERRARMLGEVTTDAPAPSGKAEPA